MADRRSRFGGNSVGVGGKSSGGNTADPRHKTSEPSSQKADQGVLAILRPSREAIELADLLGKDLEWLNVIKVGGAKFRWSLSDLNDEARTRREALRSDKKLPPTQRQEQLTALTAEEKATARKAWVQRRGEAMKWVGLVQAYKRHRNRIRQLDRNGQLRAATELVTAYETSDYRAMRDLGRKAKQADAQEKAKRKERQIAGLVRKRGHKARNADRTKFKPKLTTKTALDPIRAYREYASDARKMYEELYADAPWLLGENQKMVRRAVLDGNKLARIDERHEMVYVGVPKRALSDGDE